jgi:hypothetical protein
MGCCREHPEVAQRRVMESAQNLVDQLILGANATGPVGMRPHPRLQVSFNNLVNGELAECPSMGYGFFPPEALSRIIEDCRHFKDSNVSLSRLNTVCDNLDRIAIELHNTAQTVGAETSTDWEERRFEICDHALNSIQRAVDIALQGSESWSPYFQPAIRLDDRPCIYVDTGTSDEGRSTRLAAPTSGVSAAESLAYTHVLSLLDEGMSTEALGASQLHVRYNRIPSGYAVSTDPMGTIPVATNYIFTSGITYAEAAQ